MIPYKSAVISQLLFTLPMCPAFAQNDIKSHYVCAWRHHQTHLQLFQTSNINLIFNYCLLLLMPEVFIMLPTFITYLRQNTPSNDSNCAAPRTQEQWLSWQPTKQGMKEQTTNTFIYIKMYWNVMCMTSARLGLLLRDCLPPSTKHNSSECADVTRYAGSQLFKEMTINRGNTHQISRSTHLVDCLFAHQSTWSDLEIHCIAQLHSPEPERS